MYFQNIEDPLFPALLLRLNCFPEYGWSLVCPILAHWMASGFYPFMMGVHQLTL